jgi:hypothetical protein
MYAENIGVGSVLSPLEMTMPIGSDGTLSLLSFFILTLSWWMPQYYSSAL